MLNTIMAFLPEGGSLIVILIVVVLIFGGKKIPEVMHGLGKGIRSFKEGMNGPNDANPNDAKKDDTEPKV